MSTARVRSATAGVVVLACLATGCATGKVVLRADESTPRSPRVCPHAPAPFHLDTVRDARRPELPGQIGVVHLGLMNIPNALILEPAPATTIGRDIDEALHACNLLDHGPNGAPRILLRVIVTELSVEEDIGFSSEEMIVKLGYSVELVSSNGATLGGRSISEQARKSGIDTTEYAAELVAAVRGGATTQLLQYLGELTAAHQPSNPWVPDDS